jgi:hypothetical protein
MSPHDATRERVGNEAQAIGLGGGRVVGQDRHHPAEHLRVQQSALDQERSKERRKVDRGRDQRAVSPPKEHFAALLPSITRSLVSPDERLGQRQLGFGWVVRRREAKGVDDALAHRLTQSLAAHSLDNDFEQAEVRVAV